MSRRVGRVSRDGFAQRIGTPTHLLYGSRIAEVTTPQIMRVHDGIDWAGPPQAGLFLRRVDLRSLAAEVSIFRLIIPLLFLESSPRARVQLSNTGGHTRDAVRS